MDTSGYQVCDLDDAEFYWEIDHLAVDAVFRPGRDTNFSPSTFIDFEMGSLTKNPIVFDEDQDKQNYPLLFPTTRVSETPTQPPVLMRSQSIGVKI